MQQLYIIVLVKKNRDLLSEIAQLCVKNTCDILESQMASIGQDNLLTLHVSGKWNAIVKIERFINKLEEKDEATILTRRVETPEPIVDKISCRVHINAVYSSDVIAKVLLFFSESKIDIYESFSTRFVTGLTQTAMLSMALTILVPQDIVLADFREDFITYCDDINIDASMELDRG